MITKNTNIVLNTIQKQYCKVGFVFEVVTYSVNIYYTILIIGFSTYKCI